MSRFRNHKTSLAVFYLLHEFLESARLKGRRSWHKYTKELEKNLESWLKLPKEWASWCVSIIKFEDGQEKISKSFVVDVAAIIKQ